MTGFNDFMSIAMQECAPRGPGTGAQREAMWAALVEVWKEEEEEIRGMTKGEVRDNLRCP